METGNALLPGSFPDISQKLDLTGETPRRDSEWEGTLVEEGPRFCPLGTGDLGNEIFGHREDFHSLYDDELGVVQPDLSNEQRVSKQEG